MYQNARVMLEMADYAAKHCEGVDRLLVETLHSDAMQIRVCVLRLWRNTPLLSQRRCSRECVPRRFDVYRHGRPHDQLLQDYAAVQVPDFVAAM